MPEVGGRVDPGSDAHDLVMSLYGGMSQGRAQPDQDPGALGDGRPRRSTRAGSSVADRPTATSWPTPARTPTRKAATASDSTGSSSTRPPRRWSSGSSREYIGGAGLGRIAEGLNRDGIPSPSGHDPARNRHRAGAALGEVSGPGDPREPPLHRPPGLEPPAARRGVYSTSRTWPRATSRACGGTTATEWVWSPSRPTRPSCRPRCSPRRRLSAARGTTAGRGEAAEPSPLLPLLSGELRRLRSPDVGIVEPRRAYYRCRFPPSTPGPPASTRRSTSASPT